MKVIDELRSIIPTISTGILTADMMNLGAELELITGVGAKLLHFDVMDGRFWPKITIGAPFVKAIKTSMLKDVHLLSDRPEDHIEDFAKAGADMITFAVESCGDIARALTRIGQMDNANNQAGGILKGLSLNPATPVDSVGPFIGRADIVLLLAVSPNAAGRNFIPELPDRIAAVRKIKEDAIIFIDGGVNKNNIADVAAMGPDVVITGSAVFDGKAPRQNAKFMLEAMGK